MVQTTNHLGSESYSGKKIPRTNNPYRFDSGCRHQKRAPFGVLFFGANQSNRRFDFGERPDRRRGRIQGGERVAAVGERGRRIVANEDTGHRNRTAGTITKRRKEIGQHYAVLPFGVLFFWCQRIEPEVPIS